MKQKLKYALGLFTCMLFIPACNDEFDDRYANSNSQWYFCTSMQNWGKENRDGVGITRNGKRQSPKTEIIPVKGDSNVHVLAIYDDNFGDIKTLGKPKGETTRAVLKDEVPTDQAFTLTAFYKEES